MADNAQAAESPKQGGWRDFLFYSALLASPLVILGLVTVYGIGFPYWDQWDLVPMFAKMRAGTLTLSDVAAQHNEHWIIFPRILMLALAHLTDWDLMYEVYFIFIIACMILAAFYSILRRTGAVVPRWFVLAVSLLIFSPVQWENWIWGITMVVYMNVLFVVLAACFAAQRGMKNIALAAFFAMLATFSFGNGPMIWIVIGLLLPLRKDVKKTEVVFWGMVAAILLLVYFAGYQRPAADTSPPMYFLSHPYNYVTYVIAYLGAPLAFGQADLSAVIGLIFSGLLVTWLRGAGRDDLDRAFPLLAIVLYVLLTAGITGFGRSWQGIGQALSSRYSTFSTLFLLSTAALFFITPEKYFSDNGGRPLKKAVGVFISVMALFHLLSFAMGVRYMVEVKANLETGRNCLRYIDSADDECLKRLYHDPATVRERTRLLAEAGLLENQIRER